MLPAVLEEPAGSGSNRARRVGGFAATRLFFDKTSVTPKAR